MKVAVYSGNIPSTTFIEILIEGLSNAGFEIYLFGKKTKDVKYNSNVRVFPTPEAGNKLFLFTLKESLKLLLRNPKNFSKILKKIYSKKNEFRSFVRDAGLILPIINNTPDIFHMQWAKVIQRYPELFELLDCKFALSLRGAHINYSPLNDAKLANAYKKYFPLINGFHAVSENISKEAEKYGAERKKIKVIHSSVKSDLLKKESISYANEDILKIISIGRFHWKKGYHYALDAMKALKDESINFEFTIVAQGEMPEEIVFMINDYQLSEHVKIINGLPYESLIDKLCKSHILILPSVEEGIANVVLEAMAAGVPVLTTDCGGMDEVVTDKLNGYIIPVRDPEMIVRKIKEFIDSSDETKNKIKSNARTVIQKDFSREKQIREFREFYESMSAG